MTPAGFGRGVVRPDEETRVRSGFAALRPLQAMTTLSAQVLWALVLCWEAVFRLLSISAAALGFSWILVEDTDPVSAFCAVAMAQATLHS